MRIKQLILKEAKTATTYFGFTVKPGNFIGTAVLDDGKSVPAFWSGWTSENSIALYLIGVSSSPFWCRDEEIEAYQIETTRDFWQEYLDDTKDMEYYQAESLKGSVSWFALD